MDHEPDVVEERNELVLQEVGTSAAPVLPSVEALQQLEQGLELYQRFLSVVAKLTHPNHWVKRKNPDGSFAFTLRATGAEALANPFGIEWDEPTYILEETTDQLGKVVGYEVQGLIRSTLLGRKGWFMGYCDTRDQFFRANARAQAVKYRERECGRSRQKFTPDDDRAVDGLVDCFINRGNVKKKAFSNWVATGVARLIGLRDPSESVLRDAGIQIDRIPGVEYKGGRGQSRPASSSPQKPAQAGSKSAPAAASQEQPAANQDDSTPVEGNPISPKQVKLFWGKLFGLHDGNKAAVNEAADSICSKMGVEHVPDIQRGRFDEALQLIEDSVKSIPF